jgi:hypothetical protein
VQVALEVLPNNPQSTHLREVITPVVYFLVLTSIIVHGITIPIGKAGSRGLTLTRSLTFSRSNTINTEGPEGSGREGERRGHLHDVSRLPPPILAGSGQLPARELEDTSLDSRSQVQIELPDSADRTRFNRDIRFHDEE